MIQDGENSSRSCALAGERGRELHTRDRLREGRDAPTGIARRPKRGHRNRQVNGFGGKKRKLKKKK